MHDHGDGDATDARRLKLSGIWGTGDAHARVTITNTLTEREVLATGVADNVGLWGAIVVSSLALAIALIVRMRRAERLRR